MRLSCVKSLGKHTVYAAQESNGEVSKNPLWHAMVNSDIVVVFCVLVLFFPAIALYVSGLFTFFGVSRPAHLAWLQEPLPGPQRTG